MGLQVPLEAPGLRGGFSEAVCAQDGGGVKTTTNCYFPFPVERRIPSKNKTNVTESIRESHVNDSPYGGTQTRSTASQPRRGVTLGKPHSLSVAGTAVGTRRPAAQMTDGCRWKRPSRVATTSARTPQGRGGRTRGQLGAQCPSRPHSDPCQWLLG